MKKTGRVIISVILILFMTIFSAGLSFSGQKQKVYVIHIKGTVEPGMAAFVKRALKEIENIQNTVVVFEMDTFGGRVDAALDIVDAVSNSGAMKTIAFVEKRAISAGALIALSSNLLYMKTNTIIGDCAPIIQTQEGQEMAGEKVQTVLRAKFRSLAKKNNYPVVLAESMVTIDMEVYKIDMDGKISFMDRIAYDDLTDEEKKHIRSKKTIVAKGQLLTMDDAEAQDLKFSQKSVETLEQALSEQGYADADIIRMEESWSENFVRFLQPFLPVLMLLGIGAIYAEVKAPGFGFPGIAGIILLGLVFFNQYLAGLAHYTEFLLFLIGVLLLGIEVFVLPGFGVAGISGLLVIGAGLVLSLQDFVLPDPALPWEGALLIKNLSLVIGSFAVALFMALLFVRYVIPGLSKIVSGPYLDADLKDSVINTTLDLGIKPGDRGVAHTFLRPSGKIMVGSRKIDAIARGEFIDKDRPVLIDSIDHNRVIVKPDENG